VNTVKLNQSVTKAISILRAAGAQPGGETASGLARRTGLPWATAVRLIRTLESEGFLFRLPEGDRYVLGFDLLRLGRADDQTRLLAAVARPTLERLTGEVGETVNLTLVRADGRLEVVEQIDPPRMIRTMDLHGQPYPLHATSIGKLLLATYDDALLAEYLSAPLERHAPATITDPDDLRDELARVRVDGYSTAVDELEDGLAALSVGVSDGDGHLLAMLTVSGPSFRFDEDARLAALEPSVAAAETIGRLIAGGELATSRSLA
jgi:IclR family transcriptional regulator, acetate operon repressor